MQACYDDTKGESREKVATFHFPLSNPEILNDWIHFVNRKDWTPTSSSVICERHFGERFISRGKRCKLQWELNPIPSIHSTRTVKRLTLPTPISKHKPPKERVYQEDEMGNFRKHTRELVFNVINLIYLLYSFIYLMTKQQDFQLF